MVTRSCVIIIGCILPCVGLVLGQFPPMAGEPDRCSLPPDRRPCTNKGTVRFYFDTDTLRCSSFLFRGCPTRGNNFRSHVECLHTCLMRRGGDFFLDPHPVPDPIHKGPRRGYPDRLYGDPSVDYQYSHRGHEYPDNYPRSPHRYIRQADENYLPPDSYGPLPRRVESSGNSGYPRREMYEPNPLEYEYRRPGSYGWYREGMEEDKKAKYKKSQPPIRPPVPPVPKDGSPPRGNGWRVEVIPGGYRAVKDDRKYNGWRHTYSRVFRTHPDGIAGASFWSMVSEFDPNYDSTVEKDANDEIRRQEALIYNRVTREPHAPDPTAVQDTGYTHMTDTESLSAYYNGYAPQEKYNHLPGTSILLPSRRRSLILDVISKNRHVNNFNDVMYVVPRNHRSQTGHNVSFKSDYFGIRSPIRDYIYEHLRTSQENLFMDILRSYLFKYLLKDMHMSEAKHDMDMQKTQFIRSPGFRGRFSPRWPPSNHYIYISSGSNDIPTRMKYRHQVYSLVENTRKKHITPKYRSFKEWHDFAPSDYSGSMKNPYSEHHTVDTDSSPYTSPRRFTPLRKSGRLFPRKGLSSKTMMDILTPGYVIMCSRLQNIPCRLYKNRRRVYLSPRINPIDSNMKELDPKLTVSHPVQQHARPENTDQIYFDSKLPRQYSSPFTKYIKNIRERYSTPPFRPYDDRLNIRDRGYTPFRSNNKPPSYDSNPRDFVSVDQPIDPERDLGSEIEPRSMTSSRGRVFISMTGAGPQQPMRAFGMHQQQAADAHRIMAVRRFEGQQFVGTQREEDYRDNRGRERLPESRDAPVMPTDGDDAPDREAELIEPPPFEEGQGVGPEDMAGENTDNQHENAYSGDSGSEMNEREIEESPKPMVDDAPEVTPEEEVGAHPDAPEHKTAIESISMQPEIITEHTTSIPSTTEPVTRDRTSHPSVQEIIPSDSPKEAPQGVVPEHPVFIPPRPLHVLNPHVRPPPPPQRNHRHPPIPRTFTRGSGIPPRIRSPPPPRVFIHSSVSVPVARPPPPQSKNNPCLLPPDPGPCRAMLNRWYFNSMQGRCMILLYGGCHGNANNFVSKDECMDICQEFAMAVTADTPVANTASDNEVDKVVSPPAPPPKMSLQGNPWPGFLHLYSRLLVSTLSRVNNHLRTDLTTSSPDELRRKPSPEEPRTSQTLEESRVGEIPERPAAIETSTEDPFTSTTTNEKEISFMPLHTTPKPVIHESSSDEERRPTFEDTNSEVDTFSSDYHEDISESGEVEDSIPLRKTVEFTPSPAEVDRYHSLKDDYEEEDEEEQEDTDNPGIRLPPWERLRGRHNFRSKFEEFRSRDASKEWGRYKKFGGNGKNKGLTLMQIFVHKGEPRHPAILYPMMYRRPQMYHSSWPSSHHFASPGPRFGPLYPGMPSYREHGRRPVSENDMIFYALWQQQQALQKSAAKHPSGQAVGEANLGCLQPLDTAFCPVGQPLLRWYYNHKTRDCEIFFFGGCGAGNFNRFSTKEQCQGTCMTTSPRPDMTSDATRVIPVTTTTTPPERPTFTTTTEKLEDNTPSRESTQGLAKELEGEIENGGFEGPEVSSASMRVDRDVEYATVIAILCVGALALMVLSCLVGLYLMKKFRKTEQPKREKVVEAVLKAHLYGGMPSLPFKMPPPPPPPTLETTLDGVTKD